MTTLILRLESILETTLDSFESTSVGEIHENLLQLLRQFENENDITKEEVDFDQNSNSSLKLSSSSSSSSLSTYLNRRIPRKGMSLFHLCVGHSDNEPSIVQLFLDYGGNPNNMDCDDKISPLHLSILYEFDCVLELLLRFGGDPFLVNAEGLNSFDLAFQQSSTPALIQILLGSQIIRQLENSSFKINERGEKRNSDDFDTSLRKKSRRSKQNSNPEVSKEIITNKTSQKPPLPPSVIRSALKKPKEEDCLKTTTANLAPSHSDPDHEPEREDKASGFRISSRIRRLTLLYQQHQQNQQVQSTNSGNETRNNNNNNTPGSVKKVAFQLESEDEDQAQIINQPVDSKSKSNKNNNNNNNNNNYSEELKTALVLNEKSILKFSRLKYPVILHFTTEWKLQLQLTNNNNSSKGVELKKVDKKKYNSNNYLNYLLLDPRKLPTNLNFDKNQQQYLLSSSTKSKQNRSKDDESVNGFGLTFTTFLDAVFSVGKIKVASISSMKKKGKDKEKDKTKDLNSHSAPVQDQNQDSDSDKESNLIIPILKEASILFNETPKRRNVSLRRMSSSSTSSQFCSGDEITMADSNSNPIPTNSNNNKSPDNSREISQILNIWRSGQSVIVHRFNYTRHSSSSLLSSSSSLVSEKEAYANEIAMISALGLNLNLNLNVGLVGSNLSSTDELMRNKNQNTQIQSAALSSTSSSACSSGIKTKKKMKKNPNPNPTAEHNNNDNNNNKNHLKMRNQYGVFLLYTAYRNFSTSTNFTTNNGNNHEKSGGGDKIGNSGRVPNIF